ncbi:hypothetical protein BZG36_05492 [Bifiguratus adelaidae]|uniref:Uncharacterized protein n=1 Tax=Bifiguratus adelaidae TaxID=1938954 RepID=A0A261XV06_9FUNG|nr:hypothetical protein BZG36_05492 [Bifiguratus adelaidae]
MSSNAKKDDQAPSVGQAFTDTDIIISTTNDLPGYEVVQVLGVVYGLTVRSRNLVANIGAGLKSMVGGELGVLTNNLYMSRNKAVDRMIGECMGRGGNAIIAFRYDTGEVGSIANEVCAYGTAVVVKKIEKQV